MTKYRLRMAMAWIVFAATVAAGVQFGPAALTAIHGGDSRCLDQFSLSGTAQYSRDFNQEQEHIWVLDKGRLYYVSASGAVEACATGDPENPTFEVMK